MSFQNHIVKVFKLYKESCIEASIAFIKNWIVLPGIIAAYLAFSFAINIFGGLGIVGGFILGAIVLALMTFYYNWVRETVLGRTLKFSDLIEFDTALFFQLMGVAFIFWIFNGLLLEPFVISTGNHALYLGVQLLIFLLFNPVAETVYQKGIESVEALKYSFEFVKEHWLEWFIPLTLVITPALVYLKVYTLSIFANTDVMLPGMLIFNSWKYFVFLPVIFKYAICLLMAHWFMLFRGHLFIGLDSGKHRRLY